MPKTNTFILGLGVQKSATTWLHKYLQESETFDPGFFRKGYRLLDKLDALLKSQHVSEDIGLTKENNKLKPLVHKKISAKIRTEDEYYRYFVSLFNDKINITADITPSYSGLSVKCLSRVKSRFAALGVQCKAILLIRDPVERCKSAVFQMRKKRKDWEPDIHDFCTLLQRYYKTEHARRRTSYHQTITNIMQCFAPSEFYIGVYESMFERRNIEKMSSFLGVPPDYDFAEEIYNKTPKNKKESCPEIEKDVREYYRDVYAFCHEHVPETKLYWRSPMGEQPQ